MCGVKEVWVLTVCPLAAGGSQSRVKSDLQQLLRSRTNGDGHQTGPLCVSHNTE